MLNEYCTLKKINTMKRKKKYVILIIFRIAQLILEAASMYLRRMLVLIVWRRSIIGVQNQGQNNLCVKKQHGKLTCFWNFSMQKAYLVNSDLLQRIVPIQHCEKGGFFSLNSKLTPVIVLQFNYVTWHSWTGEELQGSIH